MPYSTQLQRERQNKSCIGCLLVAAVATSPYADSQKAYACETVTMGGRMDGWMRMATHVQLAGQAKSCAVVHAHRSQTAAMQLTLPPAQHRAVMSMFNKPTHELCVHLTGWL